MRLKVSVIKLVKNYLKEVITLHRRPHGSALTPPNHSSLGHRTAADPRSESGPRDHRTRRIGIHGSGPSLARCPQWCL